VRSLERAVGGVVRYKAAELAEHLDALASQQEGTASPFRGAKYNQVVEKQVDGQFG
jgi:hypothetical protein